MSFPFTFQVPADARYRALAPVIAAKYAELAGGSAADGSALEASLAAAMDELPSGTDADFELSFRTVGGQIEVTVRRAGRSTVVHHSVPAPKG